MTENRGNLQKYAMHFGTYMGVYWILKFILFPLGMGIPFLMFLFIGLTLGVPFMGYYYVRTYRNKICGGSIKFLQAWVFTVFMYMFAALLTAVAHYIYFRFIDHGFVVNAYMEILEQSSTSPQMAPMASYVNQLKEVLELVKTLTPIDITMQLMSQNVFYGSILAVPTALLVMRKPKSPEVQPL